MESVIVDLDYFIPILCLGKNGAQTRHMSVLIGRAQTKQVGLRHGSHTSRGNEIIFIDPHQGVHDDENHDFL